MLAVRYALQPFVTPLGEESLPNNRKWSNLLLANLLVSCAYAAFEPSFRYHSTVLLNPSPSDVLLSKPNKFFALLTSKRRLGCPFGFEGSKRILPEYPTIPAIVRVSSRIETSCPPPMFTGSPPSYFSIAMTIASAASST